MRRKGLTVLEASSRWPRGARRRASTLFRWARRRRRKRGGVFLGGAGEYPLQPRPDAGEVSGGKPIVLLTATAEVDAPYRLFAFAVARELRPQGLKEVFAGLTKMPVPTGKKRVDARYVSLLGGKIRVIAIRVGNPRQPVSFRPVYCVSSAAMPPPVFGKRHRIFCHDHGVANDGLAARYVGRRKPDDPVSAHGIAADRGLAACKTAEATGNVWREAAVARHAVISQDVAPKPRWPHGAPSAKTWRSHASAESGRGSARTNS
jgi:hypothetical protein